ncbi:MAG: GNAT family N-acetyltransferase [Bacteroidia bacterium]
MLKPVIIVRSKRLNLRELSENDAEYFYDLNSIEKVLRFTGDKPFKSIDKARLFLKQYVKTYTLNNMGRWAVIKNSNNSFIGWCGLKKHHDQLIDLGFRFYPKYWNQGFATEAAYKSLHYGFSNLNIKRIIANVQPQNKASIRVIEKLGFEYTGTSIKKRDTWNSYVIEKDRFFDLH